METGRGEEVIYGPASIRLLPPTKGWRVTKKTHASSYRQGQDHESIRPCDSWSVLAFAILCLFRFHILISLEAKDSMAKVNRREKQDKKEKE